MIRFPFSIKLNRVKPFVLLITSRFVVQRSFAIFMTLDVELEILILIGYVLFYI